MPSPKQSISLLALLLQFLDPCSIVFAWPTSSLLDSLGLERSSDFAVSARQRQGWLGLIAEAIAGSLHPNDLAAVP